MTSNGNGHRLTPKQRLFVDEYLVDLNITKAAIRAGYSERSASVVGHETLGKPKVAEAIAAALTARARRTEITADNVLKGFASIAFPETDSGITVPQRQRALESLARHLGLFNDKLSVTGAVQVTFGEDDRAALRAKVEAMARPPESDE